MSSRACPDWPLLMELAPDLQFKHYTVAEAHLPAEALVNLPNVPLIFDYIKPEFMKPGVTVAQAEEMWRIMLVQKAMGR